MKHNGRSTRAVLSLVAAALIAAGCGEKNTDLTVKEPVKTGGAPSTPADSAVSPNESLYNHFILITAQAKEAREVTSFLDANVSKADKATADRMFLELEQYYDKHLPGLNANLAEITTQPGAADKLSRMGYPADFNKIQGDESLKQWLKNQAAGKLALSDRQGDYYWKVDYAALNKAYSAYLSDDLQQYLTIRAAESDVQATSDGSITITRDELGSRILLAEHYLTSHPDGLKKTDILQLYKMYLGEYIHGYRYEAVDENSMKLLPEVKQSYERLVREHSDSKTAVIVGAYLRVLQDNNDVIYNPGKEGESIFGDPKAGIAEFWGSLDKRVQDQFPDSLKPTKK
ncbi:hypothetical protein [Paenibacillus lutrae]|uniref:hypothetical protein n=1 Tax=Paenibacillus lutrae TaxID=2078573 RepID=UPI001F216ED0|nr:hypothetical protein [Paenibacillus lutrae]